jgi:PAS domain S-box-containing protein
MGSAPSTLEPHSLYELSWTYAQDGKIAIDAGAGTILDANPAMEALMGYSRAELIGMQVTMLHPEAERERVKVEIRKAALKGSPHPGFHIQRKDGSLASVAIWSSESLKPGSGPILIVEFRDLTAHNDREEHLVRMEARYRGLLEAAPDGIVVVNQGGEIVLLNSLAEKQFGYRRDELLGQKVTSIIPEGFAERLIADGTRTAAEALAQQIGTGIELVALRKDGSEFPIEIMLSPLESAEGILVTAAIRDSPELGVIGLCGRSPGACPGQFVRGASEGHLRGHHAPIHLCACLCRHCGRWPGKEDSSCRGSGQRREFFARDGSELVRARPGRPQPVRHLYSHQQAPDHCGHRDIRCLCTLARTGVAVRHTLQHLYSASRRGWLAG